MKSLKQAIYIKYVLPKLSKEVFFCNIVNCPNFITRLCLLLKLLSEMGFVLRAWEFDDVMTFKYLKS